MSIRKRIRAYWSALTAPVNEFTCPCGHTSIVLGWHPPDFQGLLCVECDERDMEKWLDDFYERNFRQQDQGAA